MMITEHKNQINVFFSTYFGLQEKEGKRREGMRRHRNTETKSVMETNRETRSRVRKKITGLHDMFEGWILKTVS